MIAWRDTQKGLPFLTVPDAQLPLSCREVGEHFFKCGLQLLRQANFNFYLVGVAALKLLGFEVSEPPLQGGQEMVVEADDQLRPGDALAARQLSKRRLHSRGVGLDHAALAELDPAEVAGHHHRRIAEAAVLQCSQHRLAGNAVRFAIIAQADPVTAAGRADQVGPAVVTGVREFGFEFERQTPALPPARSLPARW